MSEEKGLTTRESFGSTEMARSGEVGSTAQAALATAAIQARYVVAMQRPRNLERTCKAIVAECKRPEFAEMARYRRPVGKEQNAEGKWVDKVATGFSIRFVETALRCMGNIHVERTVIQEDADSMTIRVSVTDLEANVVDEAEMRVPKTVERRKLKAGQVARSSRLNSYGDQVYIVDATEAEVMQTKAALESKAKRRLGEALIPGWIKDAALSTIRDALQVSPADMAKARTKTEAAFRALKISGADLERYLGHPVSTMSGEELQELREVYAALKEGETSWEEVLDQALEARGIARAEKAAQEPAPPTNAEALKAAAEIALTETPEHLEARLIALWGQCADLVGQEAASALWSAPGGPGIYTPGATKPRQLPDKARKAQEIVARLEAMDDTGLQRLRDLGKDAAKEPGA